MTKKLAKQSAAVAALELILIKTNSTNLLFNIKTSKIKIFKVFDKFPNDLYERIGNTVSSKFDELDEIFNNRLQEAKIVAAFLLYDSKLDKFEVISLTTGNQSISGDKLALDGSVLNDCHGEILARRFFICFIYLTLLNKTKSTDNYISFEANANGDRLKLKSNFTFHFFCSTTSCGDGRIFSMNEFKDNRQKSIDLIHQPIFTDVRKQGLLRCKIENGHGSIPVLDCCEFQTLDGIMGGERLRTMSCSDKILKWNVLGIQGCLLTQFIEPVYLSSITIGSLYHHGHMARAACCRLSDIQNDLSAPYHLNHPLLGQGGINKGRDTSKFKSMMVNWNSIEGHILELIDGRLGVTRCRLKSRLCKFEFYKMYKILMKTKWSEYRSEMFADQCYYDAKRSNAQYQSAKNVFMKSIVSKKYGRWSSKPREEKLFR